MTDRVNLAARKIHICDSLEIKKKPPRSYSLRNMLYQVCFIFTYVLINVSNVNPLNHYHERVPCTVTI